MTPKAILSTALLLTSLLATAWPRDVNATPRSAPSSGDVPAAEVPVSVEAPAVVDPERLRQAEELMDWGIHRYVENGLELPEISLVVHPSLQSCGGRVGRYDERTNELWLCRIDRDTVLHELAHAWIDRNLDDATRAAFTELRGAEDWNDRSQPWKERATEQAAEILVWGLLDHDSSVRWVEDGIESRRLLSIDRSSPTELATGFEFMTGTPPVRLPADAEPAAAFSPEVRG